MLAQHLDTGSERQITILAHFHLYHLAERRKRTMKHLDYLLDQPFRHQAFKNERQHRMGTGTDRLSRVVHVVQSTTMQPHLLSLETDQETDLVYLLDLQPMASLLLLSQNLLGLTSPL